MSWSNGGGWGPNKAGNPSGGWGPPRKESKQEQARKRMDELAQRLDRDPSGDDLDERHAANEEWDRLNMDYQLHRATGQ